MSLNLSLCDFLAGWTGGIIGLAVGHPIDTLKVRQQLTPGGGSIASIARSIYRTNGVAGFFKGLLYPVLGSGIYNALFFGVYGNCLRALQGVSGSNVRKMCCEGEPPKSTWHRDVFLAGCVGGVCGVVYSCPLELIKIKLQAQTARSTSDKEAENFYRGSYDALRKIYKSHGIYRGLYRGFWILFWRDVPTFGLYVLAYEHILCLFKHKEDRSSKKSILSQIVAGGVAGLISWILVGPLDVIKTRIQSDDLNRPLYNGVVDCIKKTIRQEGYSALFLGLTLAAVRSVPVNASTFVGYEFTMEFCERCGFCKEIPMKKKHEKGKPKDEK